MVDSIYLVWQWVQGNWAGIVASSAVLITIQQYFQQRRHDKLSVRAYVSFSLGTTSRGVEVSVSNDGLGPALYKEMNVIVQGNELPYEWRWNYLLEGIGAGAIKILDSHSMPKCLPAGRTVILCRFASEDNVPHEQLVVQFGKSVQMTLKYSSIYRERPITAELDVRKQFATLD